jgi:hypothetical protein
MLFVNTTHAGAVGLCRDPLVLPGVAVQVYILPYQATTQLSDRGRELATAIQRHVLFAALKYENVAVEELTQNGERCDIGSVSRAVNHRLTGRQIAVFLWGRIFEQGNQILLQSAVEYGGPRGEDSLTWDLSKASSLTMNTTTPAGPILFAPRVIPMGLLDNLKAAQLDARQLHSAPKSDSPFWQLSDDSSASFSYQVEETQGDWMHVKLAGLGRDGWLQAHILASGENLKGSFAELYFIDGLVGYLEMSVAPSGSESQNRFAKLSGASLDRYLSTPGLLAESEPRSLAAVLKGNAILKSSAAEQWPTEILHDAQLEFSKARSLAPLSSAINNFFLACEATLCARGNCARSGAEIRGDFLEAIAQDPTNRELVQNLGVLYKAASAGLMHIGLSSDAIDRQLTLVQRAQRSIN